MIISREIKNASAAIRAFNKARGKRYLEGDESDLTDLLLALMALANNMPGRYGTFDVQLSRAEANYKAESGT